MDVGDRADWAWFVNSVRIGPPEPTRPPSRPPQARLCRDGKWNAESPPGAFGLSNENR